MPRRAPRGVRCRPPSTTRYPATTPRARRRDGRERPYSHRRAVGGGLFVFVVVVVVVVGLVTNALFRVVVVAAMVIAIVIVVVRAISAIPRRQVPRKVDDEGLNHDNDIIVAISNYN